MPHKVKIGGLRGIGYGRMSPTDHFDSAFTLRYHIKEIEEKQIPHLELRLESGEEFDISCPKWAKDYRKDL